MEFADKRRLVLAGRRTGLVWVVGFYDRGARAIGHVGSPREVLAYFASFSGPFPVIVQARTFCAGSWPYPDREEVPSEAMVLGALGLVRLGTARSGRFREDLRQVFGTEEGVVTSRVEGVTDPDYRWR